MRWLIIPCLTLILSACTPSPQSTAAGAIAELSQRDIRFPDYPQPNTTYLSFSQGHGFQVNYLAPQGRAWLWYPGNLRGVPEEYTQRRVGERDAICWRHPSDSFNPVTQTRGGDFACMDLGLARRTIIAALPGDPFDLASGRVPYQNKRCTAPQAFVFDRTAFGC